MALIDLHMKGLDGISVIRALQTAGSPARLVMLTVSDSSFDVMEALKAGAAGYLLKDAEPEVIAQGIRDAAAGGLVLSPDLERRVADRMTRGVPQLSDREREVLQLVASGLANKEVARALFISEGTVKTHLVHIFGKLGADSRTEAVAAARAHGLIA